MPNLGATVPPAAGLALCDGSKLLQRGLLIPALIDEAFKHLTLVIDGPPERAHFQAKHVPAKAGMDSGSRENALGPIDIQGSVFV
ncbi:MAG: hypothetical protein ING31_12025 [Burkholderiales bacterium]|nr:hypothetical protein [Burkholderiales bacterium]